jgi:hypothetical protein
MRLNYLLIPLVTPLLSYGADGGFAFVNDSVIPESGELEVEASSTYNRSRETYYRELIGEIELGYGIDDKKEISLTLTYAHIKQDDGTGTINAEAELRAVAGELTYRLADRSTSAFGSALSLEVGIGSEEQELEVQLIADKNITSWIVAYNTVYELDIESAKYAHQLQNRFGLAYEILDKSNIGLEFLTDHTRNTDGATRGACYAGPQFSCAFGSLEFAFSALWQITTLGHTNSSHNLELEDHERFRCRLLVEFEL